MADRGSCCFNLCSLQVGTVVIGTLGLVWNPYVACKTGPVNCKTSDYNELWGKYDTETYLVVAFIFAICQTICSILLLFGAIQEKHALLLPWMVVKTLSAIAIIVIAIAIKGIYGTLIIIIYVLVDVPLLVVVIRYYQTLREKSRAPKVRESVEMCEVRKT